MSVLVKVLPAKVSAFVIVWKGKVAEPLFRSEPFLAT